MQYAGDRGIRVLPEFDSPAHTLAWGKGAPTKDLLTSCDGSYPAEGPLRPDLPSTYSFLQTLLGELKDVFPDSVFHAGGDEVKTDCWSSNPDVARWMKEKGFTETGALATYMASLFEIVNTTMGKGAMVWRPGAADTLPTEKPVPPKPLRFFFVNSRTLMGSADPISVPSSR